MRLHDAKCSRSKTFVTLVTSLSGAEILRDDAQCAASESACAGVGTNHDRYDLVEIQSSDPLASVKDEVSPPLQSSPCPIELMQRRRMPKAD